MLSYIYIVDYQQNFVWRSALPEHVAVQWQDSAGDCFGEVMVAHKMSMALQRAGAVLALSPCVPAVITLPHPIALSLICVHAWNPV